MHRDHAGWHERLNYESTAFWKFEDSQRRGLLARCGSGTLGQGTMGSCTLRPHESTTTVAALHKTVSLPLVGPHPPCGRRVGEDLAASEGDGSQHYPAKRSTHLEGELEHRLQFLETFFQRPAATSTSGLKRVPGTPSVCKSIGSRRQSTAASQLTSSSMPTSGGGRMSAGSARLSTVQSSQG